MPAAFITMCYCVLLQAGAYCLLRYGSYTQLDICQVLFL